MSYMLNTEHKNNLPLVEKLFQRMEEEREEEWVLAILDEMLASGAQGRGSGSGRGRGRGRRGCPGSAIYI